MPREELVDGRGINCKYVGNRWQIASEKPMAGSRSNEYKYIVCSNFWASEQLRADCEDLMNKC